MKEEYYILPKSVVDEFKEFHRGTHWGHCTNELIEKAITIDLSDNAIEEEANEYSKEFDLSFYDTVDEIPVKELAKKDYSEALKTLKNKLNGNE